MLPACIFIAWMTGIGLTAWLARRIYRTEDDSGGEEDAS
jgi:hypothetical protein